MISKWYGLKQTACELRKKGNTIGKIEKNLGIPRSTLSGWFKDIKLSSAQKEKIRIDSKKHLEKARIKAVDWHNHEKLKRLEEAQRAAGETLTKLNTKDHALLEIALAILYFGEGSKKNIETALGSSDPLILKFFLKTIVILYGLDKNKLRYELYLRADQDPQEIKKFWSQNLNVSIDRFKQINIDQRTNGSKTYTNYHGVCGIRCGNVWIQRRLMYLSDMFCRKVVENS